MLHDHLELPGVAYHIADGLSLVARVPFAILLAIYVEQWEIDPSVLQAPALILSKFNHGTFGVQEQKILRGGDWK